MNYKLFLIIIGVIIGATSSAFAGVDLIKIKTRNGTFEYPKEQIIENPLAEGSFIYTTLTAKFPVDQCEDGSYFFDVDAESIALMLHYFSEGEVPANLFSTNYKLKRDLDYLCLPDLIREIEHQSAIQRSECKIENQSLTGDEMVALGCCNMEFSALKNNLHEVWYKFKSKCSNMHNQSTGKHKTVVRYKIGIFHTPTPVVVGNCTIEFSSLKDELDKAWHKIKSKCSNPNNQPIVKRIKSPRFYPLYPGEKRPNR